MFARPGLFARLRCASPARKTEIVTGLIILLYVAATVVTVYARTSETWDVVLTTGSEFEPDLTRRGLHPGWQLTQYSATLASCFLLSILAALAYRAFRPGSPALALTGACMFLGAGFFAGLSALIGLTLSQGYYEVSRAEAGIITSREGFALMEAFLEPVRALANRVSFTFAALGTLALGLLVAWRGVLPGWLGWFGILAAMLMLFIWMYESPGWLGFDLHFVLHRLGGGAYLAWLALTACWLTARGSSFTNRENSVVTKETADV